MQGKRKENIVLIGGGGHCKSVIDVIECEGKFTIVGIVDTIENVNKFVFNIPIIGTDDDLSEIIANYQHFHISIGHIQSNTNRVRLFNYIKNSNGNFPVIKSPFAYVSKYAIIGEGTFVGHNVVVNAGAVVGENTILNTHSLIEHDSIIGSHVHISTMCTINADCCIGNNCFLSSHVVVNRGVSLFDGCKVASGSVITKSFSEKNILLKGMPAKKYEQQ